MSLLPPSVTHVQTDSYYFPLAANGNLVNPTIVPASGDTAGSLRINNGLAPSNPNSAYTAQFMPNVSGGGLSAGHYQTFLYSPQVGGNGIGQVFDAYGNGNNEAILKCNLGVPLDPARIGYTLPSNGATPVVVPCTSISAGSTVIFSWVAGTSTGGLLPPVVAAIVPGVSFSFTAGTTVGAIYSYTVYG